MSYNRVAQVTSWNPAQRFGLNARATSRKASMPTSRWWIPRETWTIRAKDVAIDPGLHALRGTRAVGPGEETFLRGRLIYQDGNIVGKPSGEYLFRPTA